MPMKNLRLKTQANSWYINDGCEGVLKSQLQGV